MSSLAPLVQANEDDHDDQQNGNGVTISDRFHSSDLCSVSCNFFMFNSLLNQLKYKAASDGDMVGAAVGALDGVLVGYGQRISTLAQPQRIKFDFFMKRLK